MINQMRKTKYLVWQLSNRDQVRCPNMRGFEVSKPSTRFKYCCFCSLLTGQHRELFQYTMEQIRPLHKLRPSLTSHIRLNTSKHEGWQGRTVSQVWTSDAIQARSGHSISLIGREFRAGDFISWTNSRHFIGRLEMPWMDLMFSKHRNGNYDHRAVVGVSQSNFDFDWIQSKVCPVFWRDIRQKPAERMWGTTLCVQSGKLVVSPNLRLSPHNICYLCKAPLNVFVSAPLSRKSLDHRPQLHGAGIRTPKSLFIGNLYSSKIFNYLFIIQ